jgi:hypothetical protein
LSSLSCLVVVVLSPAAAAVAVSIAAVALRIATQLTLQHALVAAVVASCRCFAKATIAVDGAAVAIFLPLSSPRTFYPHPLGILLPIFAQRT